MGARGDEAGSMLTALESIPWSALRHAGGAAGDVPALIRDLLSPSDAVRAQAIGELFNTIVHQGTAYEASACAVPFLQELLSSDETPDRVLIADLLAALAQATSDLEAASHSEAMTALLRDALRNEGRDFEKELESSRRFVRETKAAVGSQLQLLYPYLTCGEAEVRKSVAGALKNYPQRARETLPLLQQAASHESNTDVRGVMEAAIAALRVGDR